MVVDLQEARIVAEGGGKVVRLLQGHVAVVALGFGDRRVVETAGPVARHAA